MVKRIISMVLCVLLMFGSASAFAASEVRSSIAPQFTAAGSFFEGLAVVKMDDKWGFIDKTGKIVIECKFEYADNFYDGKALVGKGNPFKYGFIDKTGKEILPYVYDHIFGRNDGYLNAVKIDPSSREEYNGMIDPEGKEIIPCDYSYVDNVYDDRIKVETHRLLEQDGSWSRYDMQVGFYDTKGKLVIPLLYDDASGFKDGLAWVSRNGKYGFIDKTGKVVIPLEYDRISQFHNGLAQVSKNGKYGFIDKSGTLVITGTEPYIINEYWDGITNIELNLKYGFMDRNGKVIVPCEYDETSPFNDGMALVAKGEDELYNPSEDPESYDYIVLTNKKFGYVNTAGKLVVPLKYDYAKQFINGFGIVGIGGSGASIYYMNGKLGYVNTSGKEIVPCKYDYVCYFREGMGRVSVDGTGDMGNYQDGKWGFVNEKGEEAVPCKYDEAWDFCEGLAKVGLNGKYGYVDKSGKEVVPCIYDDVLDEFKDGMAIVMKDGKMGFIDATGREVVPCSYSKVSPFFEGMAAYLEDGLGGYLSVDQPVTPAVVASVAPGSYTGMQTVTLSCPVPGADIYCSIDNGETWFREYSAMYTEPIKVYDSMVITAVAYAKGMQQSPAVTFKYEIKQEQVLPVTASVKPGTYSKAQMITLKSATPGVTIYYTTDGTAPGADSTKYTKPIALGKSGTIRAVAIKSGMCSSNAVTLKYKIKK